MEKGRPVILPMQQIGKSTAITAPRQPPTLPFFGSFALIGHLLHHREGEKLDAWLAKCTASQIREFQSFVKAGRARQSSRCRGSDSFTEQWPG